MEMLPSIETLPTAGRAVQEHVLSLLFEPSLALYGVAEPSLSQKFDSYGDLIRRVGQNFETLARQGETTTLDEVLSSHPRLGEKKVDSAISRAEQAAMIKASGGEDDQSAEEEARTLEQLNKDYEARFPGLRYVVFVNGRPRPVIFEDMKRRIARGDIGLERQEAITAMCDIAEDRAKKLQG